jgi:lysophospholipase L1-like esterase
MGATAARAQPPIPKDLTILPTDPPSLAIRTGNVELKIDPPEIRDGTAKGKIPRDYDERFEAWEPWPAEKKDNQVNYISLSPRKDERNTSILGGLYRAILPESVTVKTADGSKTFTRDTDYKYEENWGLVSNLAGKLGKPGEGELEITYKFATQRLDLLQLNADGKPSIKAGKPMMVCPQLTAPDDGCRALAGIYVAPWKRNNAYVITAEDIYPIQPVAPVQPINAAAIANTLKKLQNGEEVRIAFLGDSVTLGAEAGPWWENLWTEKNEGYASRMVVELRKRYPKATITPIPAFKGGINTGAAAELVEKSVVPAKPDLLLIAFGLNDAHGPVKGPPINPPAKYKEDILAIIKTAKQSGSEVLLVVPFEPNPFLKNGIAKRILDYRKVLLDLSKEQNVACADVYTEWMNQAKSGIPPFSQLHNWNNHPGPEGHKVYADVLLRFFETK